MTGKLIDADALIEKIIETAQDLRTLSTKTIGEAIHKTPTIDAVPVKRGKWIKADSQQYFRKHYPCFTCSECGYRKDSQKKWNYCPNCGADMRGAEE